MTDSQFNLFEQIEEEEKKAKSIRNVQEQYKLWLSLPEIVPFDKERAGLHYAVSCSPLHMCPNMPDDVSVWWNVGASVKSEYWVVSRKNKAGEVVENCPFCNANLAGGQGDRFLKKWARGYTFFKEKSVREYYRLDEVEVANGYRYAN